MADRRAERVIPIPREQLELEAGAFTPYSCGRQIFHTQKLVEGLKKKS
jgi:hypothetical protein